MQNLQAWIVAIAFFSSNYVHRHRTQLGLLIWHLV